MFSVKRRFVSTTVFVVSTLLLASASPVTVEDGVYSRVTVQIEAQPQPENCVEFLNQLEVRREKSSLASSSFLNVVNVVVVDDVDVDNIWWLISNNFIGRVP